MNSIWRFLPFLAVTLTVDVGLHLFLYRRLVRAVTGQRGLRLAGGILFGLLGALLALGPMIQRAAHGPATLAVRGGYLWMGVSFYLFLSLSVFELAFALERWMRRTPPKTAPAAPADPAAEEQPADPGRRELFRRAAGLGAMAITAPAVVDGVWSAFSPPQISTVEVKLPNLPKALSGLSFVQFSDVHVGAWIDERFLRELAERAQALKPDFFAITGDLMDGSVARLGSTVGLLGALRSRYGTYFVTGNHEYYSGVDEWVPALRGMGMTVLRNQRVELGDKGASLDLVGVDDWGARRQGFGDGYDLDAALRDAEPGRARILMAHQPTNFAGAVERGVGLQVSGHTHGGQLWPWLYLVRMVYPYTAGRYTLNDSTIYVSRGCGFWGPPMRLGVPPELVRYVLV